MGGSLLFALGERAYQQLGHGQWRPDPGSYHRFSAELEAALGDRYGQMLASARDINLDDGIAELIRPWASDDSGRARE